MILLFVGMNELLNPSFLLQLMAVGGNHKARQFFKQHGYDEVGSDKIESKVSTGAQMGCRCGLPPSLTFEIAGPFQHSHGCFVAQSSCACIPQAKYTKAAE
jgi:hypothetical protein